MHPVKRKKKNFRFWVNYSTEWLLQLASRLSLLGTGGEIYTAIKTNLEKKLSGNHWKWYSFVSFYLWLLDVFFWGRYSLSLIIGLKNMVLISLKSLKSFYEDLWSPLIFKQPKFSKISAKISKSFLKVFSLFISVEKISSQYLWNILERSSKIYFIYDELSSSLKFLEHLLNIFNLGEMQKNMLKYTKKSLYCMFHF